MRLKCLSSPRSGGYSIKRFIQSKVSNFLPRVAGVTLGYAIERKKQANFLPRVAGVTLKLGLWLQLRQSFFPA